MAHHLGIDGGSDTAILLYNATMETRLTTAAFRLTGPFLLFFVAGCQSLPKVHKYPGLDLTVIHADPNTVEKNCRDGFTKEDDGSITGNGALSAPDNNGLVRYRPTKHRGCFKPAEREIWLSWTADVETVLHELRHFDDANKAGIGISASTGD